MLSTEEKHEIDHELSKSHHKRGACIDALQIVQKYRGHINDEALKDIADYLDMSQADLDSVATFYNRIFRKPVGKHVIKICDSVSCYVMEYEKILQDVQTKLGILPGQTTQDRMFTLLTTQCLGTCDKAPAMMINDDLHRNLNSEKMAEILHAYRQQSSEDKKRDE